MSKEQIMLKLNHSLKNKDTIFTCYRMYIYLFYILL